MDNIIDSGI